METARRYDTKLPCPVCKHLQSATDPAKLYPYSTYRVSWGDQPRDDDYVTDYMPHCNGCGVALVQESVKVLEQHGWGPSVGHWYWRTW